MLTRRTPGRMPGFTLIELMVTLTIIGLLVALTMPSFSMMIQNSKLGSAAKSYALGVQTARTEAIRRNLPVEFVLTDTPIGAGMATAATATAGGKNWMVRYLDPVSAAYVLVESRGAQEGSAQVGTSSIRIAGTTVSPASVSFNGIVAFNGFGGTSTGELVVFDVTNPGAGQCAAAGGPMRCQRIQVRPGGQVNLCDPAAAATDSRACPP